MLEHSVGRCFIVTHCHRLTSKDIYPFGTCQLHDHMSIISKIIGSCPTVVDRTETITSVFFPSSAFSLSPRTARSLDLPEVIVDGQGIYADRHRLGGDDGELLSVRAVFVELVDHLAGDSTRPCACELDDLLGVG